MRTLHPRECTASECSYGTSPWNSVNGHGLAPAAVMTPSTCELSDAPLYDGRQPLSKAMMPLTPPADVRRVANESVPDPVRFAAAQPPEPAKTVYDPVPFTESGVHVRLTTTPIPDVEYPDDHGPSRRLGAGGDVSADPHAASSTAEM